MANMWVKQCHEPMTGNGFNIPPMVMTGELFLYGGFTKSWGYPKKIIQLLGFSGFSMKESPSSDVSGDLHDYGNQMKSAEMCGK